MRRTSFDHPIDVQSWMTELVAALLLWVGGREARISVVRMLELADLFRDRRMMLWCGAATELADVAFEVRR